MPGLYPRALVALSAVATRLCLPAAADDLLPGLPAVLFHDTSFSRPAERQTDSRIDMQISGTNDCSKLWIGRLRAPRTAEVTFRAEAQQGLRLYLDGRPVIDGWSPEGERSGTMALQAGQVVALRVEYYHLGAEAYLRLYWSWPGQPEQLVPAAALWHTAADAAVIEQIAKGEREVAPGNVGPHGPVVQAPAGDEAFCSSTYQEGVTSLQGPLSLGPGPHLFIDDGLIASQEGLSRRVNCPRRDPAIPNPIVTGKEDRCFQPFLTVLRDEAAGRFRIWYGMYTLQHDVAQSHLGYMESEDGIHWRRPARQLDDPGPIQFGDSVIDHGPEWPDKARRYTVAWWHNGGMKLATSPDGLQWTPLVPHVVLRHNHDIVNITRDTLRGRYVATASVYTTGPTWSKERRVTMHSESTDLLNWSRPWYVLTPVDGIDEGETQFYAMNGYLIRGDLWIGLVKVLRDDLRAEGTPEGAFGIGYTTLAWSRDGRNWVRDRTPFLEPDPRPGAWDHAHAWIDCQLPVEDQVFLYYGGYKNGHKMNRFQERQIGLLRMPRDRYVSRDAGGEPGLLRTPVAVLQARSMTVNAEVAGELTVAVLGADGAVLPGFSHADCRPLQGDALDAPVRWQADPADLAGTRVALEFRLREGRLYGFCLQ